MEAFLEGGARESAARRGACIAMRVIVSSETMAML